MRFRLRAFGLHLLGSATALTLILGGLYLGWYRWPGWYLSSVLHVVGILVMVDVVIGPTLTLIIANPNKHRRELTRDIGMIIVVQLIALGYGAVTLWGGRPLYYAFSVNSLDMVQASDIEAPERNLALQQNPTFAPHWYSLPRWIWAPLPRDRDEANKIVTGTIFGGADVTDMPRYFKPWEQGLPQLRDQLARVDDIRFLSRPEKQVLRTRLSQLGVASDQKNALIMWGGSRRVLVVFDPATLNIKTMLIADPKS
jgi:hypothetical protein